MQPKRALILAVVATGLLPAQFPDFTPPTPLIGALMQNDTAEAKRLLAAGANPNEPTFLGFPPVFFPVSYQNLELLGAMVEKGADVQARDRSGSTALMWAAYNETGETVLVEELLRLGVDPHAANQAGETAMTWAVRRGHTEIVAALRRVGVSSKAPIKDSAERAIALLQKSGSEFISVSACVSCHHQFLPQMVVAVARTRGVAVDEPAARLQTKWTTAVFQPVRDELLRHKQKLPDPAITASYTLLALGADQHPADETTAALTELVAHWQRQDGSFPGLPLRPPMEGSDFTATTLSLRALQLYGQHTEEQVARAAEWLRGATPRTTEDRAMQLLGLGWANAKRDDLGERARGLLAEQRPDGGWAQLPGLETDAYATGQALVALHWGARVSVYHPAYRRGIAYLLRTQFADGSWLVRTRAFPFQPYKESGFPHGKDQWISAAGTSWAAMALCLALPAKASNHEGSFELTQRGDIR